MKRVILKYTCIALLFVPLTFSQNSQGVLEAQVRSDLNDILEKIVQPKDFILKVKGSYRTKRERKLIENEITRKQKPIKQKERPKELPGFKVPKSSYEAPIDIKNSFIK